MFELKIRRIESKIERNCKKINECDDLIEAFANAIQMPGQSSESINLYVNKIIIAGKDKCELINDNQRLKDKLKWMKIINLILE